METLRVGRVPFLVCAPFFHASLPGLPGVSFRDGPPRALNALLADGKLDLAPSSSIEYARHAARYRLLPGLCTSGRGEVKSVLFFSRKPWEKLDGSPVALSPESETSNALFSVISRFRFGIDPRARLPEPGDKEPEGRVLIGDAALRESRRGDWPYRYDLAQSWESWQGLPLPFGLWMVREEAWNRARDAVTAYQSHLQASLASFFAEPASALAAWEAAYPLPLPRDEALEFFSTADYRLDGPREKSLEIFFGLCRRAGWLEEVPGLRYAA